MPERTGTDEAKHMSDEGNGSSLTFIVVSVISALGALAILAIIIMTWGT